MNVVFTAKGDSWDSMIDPRFGRTEYLVKYDSDKDVLESVDNREADLEAHGVGPVTSQKLYDMGAEVLITGNGPGVKAANVLKKMNVKIYVGADKMTLKEAYDAFKENKLDVFEL